MSAPLLETARSLEALAGCHPGYPVSDADPRFDQDHPTHCATHGHSLPCPVATDLADQITGEQL